MTGLETSAATIRAGRIRRARRRTIASLVLAVLLVVLAAAMLMFGNTFYTPAQLWGVIVGQDVPGASFTVGTLRIPRLVAGILAGIAFGVAGSTFQTMLRNPLASPDVIGITSGASAAAVLALVVLHWSAGATTALALGVGIATAVVIYLAARGGESTGGRLILIGIGIGAMLDAVVQFLVQRASEWDVAVAMRWLTGSLNGVQPDRLWPLVAGVVVLVPVILGVSRGLRALELGDASATALGVSVSATRVILIVAAVALACVATATTGPIAFVALLSGPIATRIVGPGAPRFSRPASSAPASCSAPTSSGSSRSTPPSPSASSRHRRRALSAIPPHPHEPQRRFLMTLDHSLAANALSSGYGSRTIVDGVDLELPPGKISVIVGANACGKSTLLKTMSRLVRPSSGAVVLDGAAIDKIPTKKLATTLGLLPQQPIAPEGIAVADLVGRGRHPHQKMFRAWTAEDDDAVAEALTATGVADLADRSVDELSGGQRQRVWIAMALAQNTDVLLLDEPTTFLDLAHQVEVLDLLTDLNLSRGTTIAMVLHDINLAARYADHLFAMRAGKLVASGAPSEVVTPALIDKVFGLDAEVILDPVSHTPLVIPRGRHHADSRPTHIGAPA